MQKGSAEAAAIVVGNEILIGRTQDTNTLFLIEELLKRGIRLRRWSIVPDDGKAISAELSRCIIEGHELVFVSGGMGPTHDDITVESVTGALGLELVKNDEGRQRMMDRWKRLNPGKEMPQASIDGIEKMSSVPEGFSTLPNEAGMAEGLFGRVGRSTVFILPGVPREYRAIVGSKAFSDLLPTDSAELVIAEIEFNGRESQVARTLRELQERFHDVDVGSYPQGPMLVIIRLTGSRESVLRAERELKDSLAG